MTAASYRVNGLSLERATAADLDRIVAIEQASFPTPWTRKMFEVELNQNPFGQLWVRWFADQVPAARDIMCYVCFWVVFEEVRVMTLAVDPAARGRGIGRTLLQHALAIGREQGALRALLEVRESNAAASNIYTQAGFRRVAVRPRYYTNPVEDAVLMELELLLPQRATTSASSP